MRPSQLALNLGTPPGSPTRTSSDFEEVSYPSSHWSSHNEEELPMHYLSEDTARRRGKGAAAGNSVDEAKAEPDYNDEGKDVYNKIRVVRGPTLGGRPQKPPSPPASSLVSTFASTASALPTYATRSPSFSSRTLTNFLPFSTHSFHAGLVSIALASQTSSSGTRRILANSARTTSSVSSITMCTPLSERCLLAWLDCCLDMTGLLTSRVARRTQSLCRMSLCE